MALAVPSALSAAIPDKPVPERLVNDFAGVFTPFQVDSLENALVAFDDSTSNQIAVVTVRSLDGMDVAEYALRLGNKWGIGSSRNNGVLILLKPRGEDGFVDVTIQVGRGLEGAIPDIYASRIIRYIMGPHLSRDEYFPAVSEACAELQKLASGEISEPRDREGEDTAEIAAFLFFLILLVIIFIVLSKKSGNGNGRGGNGGRGYYDDGPTVIIGPRRGGFGGFSGGFGGGGFSGGGFGGFGGGSFGGGGASGRF